MLVVAEGTCTLIIVMSVYNGLEGVIKNVHGNFDPDIKVMPVKGKSFLADSLDLNQIRETPGVLWATEVIEDNALLKYKEAQKIVRVKGVNQNILKQSRFKNIVLEDDYRLQQGSLGYIIVGQGIKYALDVDLESEVKPLQLFYPKNLTKFSLNTSKLYTTKGVLLGGSYSVERQYDDHFVFISLETAKELFSYQNKLSYVEIIVDEAYSPHTVMKAVEKVVGNNFRVLDREELHADLYKILKIEKLVVFIIISLIVAIASVNIYFSLSMLVLDKKKDVSILATLGASSNLIRKIFLAEGAIISLIGLLFGLIQGLGIALLQKHFGLVKMNAQSSLINAYPVKIDASDLVYITISVLVITLLASIHPAYMASKSFSNKEL